MPHVLPRLPTALDPPATTCEAMNCVAVIAVDDTAYGRRCRPAPDTNSSSNGASSRCRPVQSPCLGRRSCSRDIVKGQSPITPLPLTPLTSVGQLISTSSRGAGRAGAGRPRLRPAAPARRLTWLSTLGRRTSCSTPRGITASRWPTRAVTPEIERSVVNRAILRHAPI